MQATFMLIKLEGRKTLFQSDFQGDVHVVAPRRPTSAPTFRRFPSSTTFSKKIFEVGGVTSITPPNFCTNKINLTSAQLIFPPIRRRRAEWQNATRVAGSRFTN